MNTFSNASLLGYGSSAVTAAHAFFPITAACHSSTKKGSVFENRTLFYQVQLCSELCSVHDGPVHRGSKLAALENGVHDGIVMRQLCIFWSSATKNAGLRETNLCQYRVRHCGGIRFASLSTMLGFVKN
jgi:hypothetical protein